MTRLAWTPWHKILAMRPDLKSRELSLNIFAADLYGGAEIELLEPLDPDNRVGKFLQRRGGGLHHVAFESDDVEADVKAARARGIELIDQKPRRGLAGMICFLHPRATRSVLVEYVQPIEEERKNR